jgi:hypothetical protein
MNTPSIAEFPDEGARLREWQRRRADEEKEMVIQALLKEPSERTAKDWTWIQYSRFGTASGCGY